MTLWTGDPRLAARADAAGVDRIGVDLERLGKAERQRGLGTWISPHAEADLAALGPALSRAALFARVNPINADSRREVEAVLARGARVLMLPMVASRQECETILKYMKYVPVGERGVGLSMAHDNYMGGPVLPKLKGLNERNAMVALIETAEGVENIDDIAHKVKSALAL